jgi:hypothetical protein
VVQEHVHTVCVPLSSLANPPAQGVSLTTATINGHSHTLALTSGMLDQLRQGAIVSMSTSVTQSHLHIFTLQRTDLGATAPAPIYDWVSPSEA